MRARVTGTVHIWAGKSLQAMLLAVSGVWLTLCCFEPGDLRRVLIRCFQTSKRGSDFESSWYRKSVSELGAPGSTQKIRSKSPWIFEKIVLDLTESLIFRQSFYDCKYFGLQQMLKTWSAPWNWRGFRSTAEAMAFCCMLLGTRL